MQTSLFTSQYTVLICTPHFQSHSTYHRSWRQQIKDNVGLPTEELFFSGDQPHLHELSTNELNGTERLGKNKVG